MGKISFLIVFISVLIYCKTHPEQGKFTADIIVYGGTSAAVTAAVQCAEMGREVILVSPDKHLGGMSSSGLGFTDTGNKEVIGGLARRFYQLIYFLKG